MRSENDNQNDWRYKGTRMMEGTRKPEWLEVLNDN